MLTPQSEKWGDTSPSSPSDRRPCCAYAKFPIQHFGKEMCHHSNGNKLHKVQESAASAVGEKHQAAKG